MFAHIEDILHYYVDTIGVDDTDNPILTSISKQCKKGIALTDRQYELVKNKLETKNELFLKNNIFLQTCLTPRLPLRQIDRTKSINIVSHNEMVGDNSVYEAYKQKWLWIKIKFPFSKKLIVTLENIKPATKEYHHVKGSHEHYFLLNSLNAYNVVSAFMNKSFEIDIKLIELYNSVEVIINNKTQHILFSEENNLYNISNEIREYIDVVSSGHDRKLIIADRSLMFSYETDYEVNNETLTSTIAGRKEPECLVNPTLYNETHIVNTIVELNRFPVVVLIDDDDNSYNQLQDWHTAFKKHIDNSTQVVLFREDSNGVASELNNYVKEHQLNNWVDKNTKVVYIKKNKLPKIIVNNFKPIAAIAKTSLRSHSVVNQYINFNCDLILYNDEIGNMWSKYQRLHG